MSMIRRGIINRVKHGHVYFWFLNLCLCFTVLYCSESDGSKKVISRHLQSEFHHCAYGRCFSLGNGSNNQTRRKRASDNSCAVPPTSPGRKIKYSLAGCSEYNVMTCITNGTVREFSRATISCYAGYSLRNITGEEPYSYCHNKKWAPKIQKCYKICDVLNPVNVQLKCFYQDSRISCDGNSLIAGVKVSPSCNDLHTYKDFRPNYREIKCGEDGKWDNPLFSCIPECGLPFDNTVKTLTSYGTTENFGDSPWHVAIYNQDKLLICGGTIITTKLILSAAHCFYNDTTEMKLNEANYEVVVSKFTRTYATIDNSRQKVFKIKEIRFSNIDSFLGIQNHYAADIAILILHGEITISPTVLPICVHWLGSLRNPSEGALGKVLGWGLNENGDSPENLTTINMPYISHYNCSRMVSRDYQRFITNDKFCAGSDTGPTVLNGDSGGGLTFKEYTGINYPSYIRGIVSVKQNSGPHNGIAAFTNVDKHIKWIAQVRDEVEGATQVPKPL